MERAPTGSTAAGTTLSVGAPARVPTARRAPDEEKITRPEQKPDRRKQAWEAGRELLLIAALFLVYKLGRGLSAGEEATAVENAHRLITLQFDLHLPDEAAFQHWYMQSHAAVTAANKYYTWVHFPATVGLLVWFWVAFRRHYVWVRNILATMTGLALIIHILVPMAPPRLMPSLGFVDTGMKAGDSPYSGVGAKIANQYAAMPSLHFGWSVVVALGITAVWWNAGKLRRTLACLSWLHPAITLLVVVVTANHYWLDAFAALLIMGLALAIVPRPGKEPWIKLPRIPLRRGSSR